MYIFHQKSLLHCKCSLKSLLPDTINLDNSSFGYRPSLHRPDESWLTQPANTAVWYFTTIHNYSDPYRAICVCVCVCVFTCSCVCVSVHICVCRHVFLRACVFPPLLYHQLIGSNCIPSYPTIVSLISIEDKLVPFPLIAFSSVLHLIWLQRVLLILFDVL